MQQAFQREGTTTPHRLSGAVSTLYEADYVRQQLGRSQHQASAKGRAGFSDRGGGSNRFSSHGRSSAETRFSILSQTESIIFEVVRGELERGDTTPVIIRARDDRPKYFPA